MAPSRLCNAAFRSFKALGVLRLGGFDSAAASVATGPAFVLEKLQQVSQVRSSHCQREIRAELSRIHRCIQVHLTHNLCLGMSDGDRGTSFRRARFFAKLCSPVGCVV